MRKIIKRLHINKHVLAGNTKNGTDNPPIAIKCSKGNHYGNSVEIQGPSKLVYSPHKPILSCGARLVLETTAKVVIDNKKVLE